MEELKPSGGRVCVCLAAALSFGSHSALALEPDHIRAGQAEIVPTIEMRAVRRSNVYLTEGERVDVDGNTVGVAPQSGTAILLHPSLVFGIEGDDTTVQLNIDMNAAQYLEEEHQNLNRYDDVELGLDFRTLNRAPVGFKVNERFHRTGRETEATYAKSAYITHVMNNTGGRVSFRPGSSLSVDLGGDFSYDKYDVSAETTVDGSPNLNSRVGYGPGVDLKWNFFPKTAIVGSYSQHWFTWENNLVDTKGDGLTESEFGDSLGIPNGSEWKARLGLRGRLTEKIVLGIIGGVGQMDYDEASVQGQSEEGDAADQGFDRDLEGFSEGLLGIVEVGYKPTDSQSLTVGYRKDFQDVYFTNFVDFHNVFARYEGKFADRFGAKASGGYRFEQYVGEVSRDDHVLNAAANLSVQITRYFEVSAGLTWRQRGSADGLHSDIEYDDVAMSMGLTGSY